MTTYWIIYSNWSPNDGNEYHNHIGPFYSEWVAQEAHKIISKEHPKSKDRWIERRYSNADGCVTSTRIKIKVDDK